MLIALDDPLVPEALLETAKTFAGKLFFFWWKDICNSEKIFVTLWFLTKFHTFVRTYFTFFALRVASKQNVIFATTRHGGHLGYFEGGIATPNTTTWIDRLVVQYCDAIAAKNRHIEQHA